MDATTMGEHITADGIMGLTGIRIIISGAIITAMGGIITTGATGACEAVTAHGGLRNSRSDRGRTLRSSAISVMNRSGLNNRGAPMAGIKSALPARCVNTGRSSRSEAAEAGGAARYITAADFVADGKFSPVKRLCIFTGKAEPQKYL